MNSRRLRPLAALAIVALIGAGCSSGVAENGTTNTTNTASSASAGAKKNVTAREKGVKFAQCMRDNGVGEFPDPDASGELSLDGVVNGSSLDPDGPAWKEAISTCKDLQPAGFTGHERSAQQQKHALKFAQCIREHGVEDFPDPAPDAPLVDTNHIPSAAADGGMDVLNAAMQQCGAIFSSKLGLTGR